MLKITRQEMTYEQIFFKCKDGCRTPVFTFFPWRAHWEILPRTRCGRRIEFQDLEFDLWELPVSTRRLRRIKRALKRKLRVRRERLEYVISQGVAESPDVYDPPIDDDPVADFLYREEVRQDNLWFCSVLKDLTEDREYEISDYLEELKRIDELRKGGDAASPEECVEASNDSTNAEAHGAVSDNRPHEETEEMDTQNTRTEQTNSGTAAPTNLPAENGWLPTIRDAIFFLAGGIAIWGLGKLFGSSPDTVDEED